LHPVIYRSVCEAMGGPGALVDHRLSGAADPPAERDARRARARVAYAAAFGDAPPSDLWPPTPPPPPPVVPLASASTEEPPLPPRKPGDPMRVRVNRIDGSHVDAQLADDAAVRDLKERVEARWPGISSFGFRLIFRNSILLEDTAKLSELGIGDGAKVACTIDLRGC